MRILYSNICTAAEHQGVIGSKVVNHEGFMRALMEAIKAHDFAQDRIPGQGFIELPEAVPHVSSGVGKRVSDPNAYCLREHRGRVGAYLKREYAAAVKSCAVVVYTLDAYVSDPDITESERLRVTDEAKPVTHVVVAVLASSADQSPHSPFRLIHNLAGGNKEAQVWDADEIRARAKVSLDYDNEWATVADPV